MEKPPDHPYAELGFPTCDLSEAQITVVRNLKDEESTLLSTRLRGPRILSASPRGGHGPFANLKSLMTLST